MYADGPGGPGQDDAGRRDLAYRLLATVVAAMRPSRRDWGNAMLAELDQVRSPAERTRFALGAARVALFPPRATPAWWAVPLGLALRAVAAAAAIHALAPAAGPAPLVLVALPFAGAWGVVTMPALRSRHEDAAPVAQGMVAAGVMGCVALAAATVESYPQVMNTSGHHGWGIGVVLDVLLAGYLALAWLLAREPLAARRNSWYALAAGLVMAIAAGYYIARPSLDQLDTGPLPGNGLYLLACLAVPAATTLSAARRGRLTDGLETGAWATLLAGLITSMMIIAATDRAAPAAAGSPLVVADAHLHGMASASAWLAADNLGGAIFSLLIAAPVFALLAGGGAVAGRALRAAASCPRADPRS
jgi:hypothetical protein